MRLELKRITAILLTAVMFTALLAACRSEYGVGGYVVRPLAVNRDMQEMRWAMERNADWNVAEDENDIHTLQAVGSEWVTEDTRIAPVTDTPDPDGNMLTADQLEITFMNENNWENMQRRHETVPVGFFEAAEVWRATHGGDADVEIREVRLSEQLNTLATMSAAGEAPDFMQMSNIHFPVLPARGLLQSLLPYERHLSLYYNTLYDRDTMAFFQWNSHYFGTIANGCADEFRMFTIFDKALFEQYGEVTPFEHWQEGNWTWTQFVRTALNMTTEGRGFGFTGWGLFPDQSPYKIMQVREIDRSYLPFDQLTDDERNGWWQTEMELTITDPRYVTWLTEVYNLYIHDGAARNDWYLQNWRDLMPRGNGDAMALGSIAHLRSMRGVAGMRNMQSDLRVAPVPVLDITGETVPRPASYGLANAITSEARSPVGAAEFIRLMTIIGLNIRADDVYNDPLRQDLNDEEWAMIEWVHEYSDGTLDPVMGVGNSSNVVDTQLTNYIHHGDGIMTVSALIDAAVPLFKAEIDRFNEQTRRD